MVGMGSFRSSNAKVGVEFCQIRNVGWVDFCETQTSNSVPTSRPGVFFGLGEKRLFKLREDGIYEEEKVTRPL
jgi:hypothetical protein